MNGLRKQNGQGSIFQVSENKWIAKISLGTRPDGRVIVKQFGGTTEATLRHDKEHFASYSRSECFIEAKPLLHANEVSA